MRRSLSRLPYSFNSDLRRPTDHFASLELDLLGDNHDEYHFVLPNQLYLLKESDAMISLMGISFSRSCLHHSLFSMRTLVVTLDCCARVSSFSSVVFHSWSSVCSP